MRSVLKACDLEDRFPILAVENNCIVSKDADIYLYDSTSSAECGMDKVYPVASGRLEPVNRNILSRW